MEAILFCQSTCKPENCSHKMSKAFSKFCAYILRNREGGID